MNSLGVSDIPGIPQGVPPPCNPCTTLLGDVPRLLANCWGVIQKFLGGNNMRISEPPIIPG